MEFTTPINPVKVLAQSESFDAKYWAGKQTSTPFQKVDFPSVNKAALHIYPQLLEQWLPGGRIEGNEYKCADKNGGKGGSFSVNVRTGVWSEFSGDESGGDPISLFAAINGLSQIEAARELSGQFGLETSLPDTNKPKPMPAVHHAIPVGASEPNCIHGKLGKPSMTWCYRDAVGQPLQYISRYETGPDTKEFRPWTWDGQKWLNKGLPDPRPLYGLDRLAAQPSAPVLICEGEKAADAGQQLTDEYVVISYSGGSNAVGKTDWTPLEGLSCLIWPDADEAGLKAAEKVVKNLQTISAAHIRQLDVSDRPDKWDAADAVEDGWLKEDFDQFVSNAKTVEIELSADLQAFNPQTISADFNAADIPVRPWLIDGMLMLGYITQLIAPPGVGKSMFSLLLGVIVALGKPLIPRELERQANVLVINNEDDMDEQHRRLAGILEHYEITPSDLTGKLHLVSGYGASHMIAKHDGKTSIIEGPAVEAIIAYCLTHNIEFIVIDPFVSTHDANENDNAAIEQVVSKYRQVGKATGAAILLVHHISKQNDNDTEIHAGNMDAGRGASALDRKKTVSNDAVSLLPVGFGNAVRINVSNVYYKVWRERRGTEAKPIYHINRRADT